MLLLYYRGSDPHVRVHSMKQSVYSSRANIRWIAGVMCSRYENHAGVFQSNTFPSSPIDAIFVPLGAHATNRTALR